MCWFDLPHVLTMVKWLNRLMVHIRSLLRSSYFKTSRSLVRESTTNCRCSIISIFSLNHVKLFGSKLNIPWDSLIPKSLALNFDFIGLDHFIPSGGLPHHLTGSMNNVILVRLCGTLDIHILFQNIGLGYNNQIRVLSNFFTGILVNVRIKNCYVKWLQVYTETHTMIWTPSHRSVHHVHIVCWQILSYNLYPYSFLSHNFGCLYSIQNLTTLLWIESWPWWNHDLCKVRV